MLIQKTESGFILDPTQNEIISLQMAINYIITALDEELSIRTGFSDLEYTILKEKIRNIKIYKIVFEKADIIMMHQLFNEICNGLYISDYINDTGFSSTEAKIILEELNKNIAA